MKRQRQEYSPALKAEIVLEVLAGEKTPLQIATERGIHVKSVNAWVREARGKIAGRVARRDFTSRPSRNGT